MSNKNSPTILEPIKEYQFNTPQLMFIGYTLAILVDLVVLSLFAEFTSYIFIESFSIALMVAILLQLLLKVTIAGEHKLANYFKSKPGTAPKVYRAITTYIILVGSKIIMLEAVNIVFGDAINFSGPFDGIVAFFVLIFGILIAEFIVSKIYFSLEDKPQEK